MNEVTLATRQFVTLFSGVLASLSAGTNYAFSAYSPQLAKRLQLSSTVLNVIGLAGNLGMYLSSPIVGRIIDRVGPTVPLICASCLLASGYGLLWQVYTQGVVSSTSSFLAALGTLLTGIGSSTALSSSVSGVARSFGPAFRATALGSNFAGFGLSAFFWTALSRLVTRGDTSALLVLLACGPALFALIGAVGCRPVHDLQPSRPPGQNVSRNPEQEIDWPNENPEESTQLLRSPYPREVCGWALVEEKDFWILWILMGCCCGTTLMVINNIGTIVEALFEVGGDNNTSSSSMQQHQAHAVSILSLFNCLGRVFAGSITDGLQARYGLGRVWWLCLIAGLFLTSQIIGFGILNNLRDIPFLSGLVGFAYGNIYGTAPALVLEWFGLNNFATNFGCLNIAPMFTGQLFNLSFGRIYDSHRDRSREGKEHVVCVEGKRCYEAAFVITSVACLLALLLSVYLGFQRSRPHQAEFKPLVKDDDDDDDGQDSQVFPTCSQHHPHQS